MRLRRSDPSKPGYTRRRRGTGFVYLDPHGRRLDGDDKQRCRDLVIPPAWTDVWICPDPAGHLQAVGTDDAGRRQYLYHPQWRARRDRHKFRHVREVASALPRLRRKVSADLRTGESDRSRVLALAVRLLDLGLFRVGSDIYATGDDPSYGVATMTVGHVAVNGDRIDFRYPAKGGIERQISLTDAVAARTITALCSGRDPDERLLAWHDVDGWHDVHSSDVNTYLCEASGVHMSAKDLRTWHATVLAAAILACQQPPTSPTAAKRTVSTMVKDVAVELGNTPAVARASYIDPAVIEHFIRGETIPGVRHRGAAAERAVLDLLTD
jgi:DNA topoisomerase IB